MEQINRILNWLKSNKSLRFIYIVLGIVLILTILKVNGSSIASWDAFIGEQGQNHYIGVPRTIRSDEWMVQTSLALSQKNNNYERIDGLVGNGEDTVVIYDAPNKHWSTLFKPHNLAFFVLPEENAFAFKWWMRSALLVIGAYLLLLFLTKYNYFLSISGALILFFTPMVQWWYSIQVMEPFAYGFLGLYFVLRILNFESKKRLIAYSIGLIYSAVAFTISFYPAFQVPIAYVLLAILVGYFLENRKNLGGLKFKFGIMAVNLILSIGLISLYFYSVKDTVKTILSTSYPGARFVNGGFESILLFLNGPYSFLFQLNSSRLPAIFTNQTEASNFITLVPFLILIPIIIYLISRKYRIENKIEWKFVTLITIFFIELFFIFFGFNNFFAKYSLFYVVPENRMMIGIGLASFFGILFFVNSLWNKSFKLNDKSIALSFSVLTIIFVALIGREIYLIKPDFIRNYILVFGVSVFFGILFYLLLTNRLKLFLCLFLLFSIGSTALVNPLNLGLFPLRNSPTSQKIQSFNNEENKDNQKWISYDSLTLGNFLISQGLPTLNGTHLYPQLDIWKKFDSDGKYNSNYNRYSHITFQSIDTDEIKFENPVPDSLRVYINPCNKVFRELNSKFILTPTDLSGFNCLQKSNIDLGNNLKVYQYISE